jgi:2-polyprenyl-3-methyl-5-hydroxy-6-metoxy-1,4-benzoquinol methylase
MKQDNCILCSGDVEKKYSMNGTDIMQCSNCGTGFVNPMPSAEEISALYHGFHPNLNADSIKKKLNLGKLFFERMGLTPDKKLKFLDVGGGSGLFARAFEKYGYGKSTYVDMDPQSCEFVRNSLGISEVINADVQNLSDKYYDEFDFIYSRHLIEHLVDPLAFIDKLLQMRVPGGQLVVQCPNGDSLEYLAYYYSNIRDRYRKIKKDTGFSKWKVLRIWLSGAILHGIDPPRHLWAFSRKGLNIWAKRKGYPVKLFTADLGDRPFSPGYSQRSKYKERIADYIGRRILSKIKGGTHLIAVFK